MNSNFLVFATDIRILPRGMVLFHPALSLYQDNPGGQDKATYSTTRLSSSHCANPSNEEQDSYEDIDGISNSILLQRLLVLSGFALARSTTLGSSEDIAWNL
jgi:hypothetical protein